MRTLTLAASAAAIASPVFAHVGDHAGGGLVAGLLHPVTGVDHLLAMVAIGLWAGLVGGAARLAVPLAFLAAMAIGCVLAVQGVHLPLVEAGILASVIALGALAAAATRLGPLAGTVLAVPFGLLHGHAHGAEMAGDGVLAYGLGMLGATAALHALGLALASPPAEWGRLAARALGGVIVLAGFVLSFA